MRWQVAGRLIQSFPSTRASLWLCTTPISPPATPLARKVGDCVLIATRVLAEPLGESLRLILAAEDSLATSGSIPHRTPIQPMSLARVRPRDQLLGLATPISI